MFGSWLERKLRHLGWCVGVTEADITPDTQQTNWRTNMKTLLLSLTIASMLTACAAGLDPAPEVDTAVSSSADEGPASTTSTTAETTTTTTEVFVSDAALVRILNPIIVGVSDEMIDEFGEATCEAWAELDDKPAFLLLVLEQYSETWTDVATPEEYGQLVGSVLSAYCDVEF
jgi:hypothetical protein